MLQTIQNVNATYAASQSKRQCYLCCKLVKTSMLPMLENFQNVNATHVASFFEKARNTSFKYTDFWFLSSEYLEINNHLLILFLAGYTLSFLVENIYMTIWYVYIFRWMQEQMLF